MRTEHVTDRISGFVDGELSAEERRIAGEHLMQCESCRREHDELRFAASLAIRLPAADAPPAVWASIEDVLDRRHGPRLGLIPHASILSWRNGFALAASIAAVSILSVVVYLNLFADRPAVARQSANSQAGTPVVAGGDVVNGGNSQVTEPANGVAATDTNVNSANSNKSIAPQPEVPSWEVEAVAGKPLIGDGSEAGRIAVGQLLETDANSKARITVANIGSVEVAPNSRVKLVGTSKDEHRLALERGRLHAKILAPPRLFIVDTPTATAVDLGCEYTLAVDRAGNSLLRVTSGFVALEDGGRESIVPAGMMCLTRKGKGLGTPFSAETDTEFRRALEQFDFANGGSLAVRSLLAKADFYDMVTLWHLLSRVGKSDRGAVFDQLADYVKPPAGVTREGVLNLDKKMLEAWRAEVESVWFS